MIVFTCINLYYINCNKLIWTINNSFNVNNTVNEISAIVNLSDDDIYYHNGAPSFFYSTGTNESIDVKVNEMTKLLSNTDYNFYIRIVWPGQSINHQLMWMNNSYWHRYDM